MDIWRKINSLDDVREALQSYYEVIRTLPPEKLPTYAKSHIWSMRKVELNSEDKSIIASRRERPSPQEEDDMYYIDYYWMCRLLSMEQRHFIELKIRDKSPNKVIFRSFPFSRTSLSKYFKRCLQKILDFENNKNIDKSIS